MRLRCREGDRAVGAALEAVQSASSICLLAYDWLWAFANPLTWPKQCASFRRVTKPDRDYSREKIASIAKDSQSLSDILRAFGLKPQGSNSRKNMKRLIAEYEIDISHFPPSHTIGLSVQKKSKTLEEFVATVLICHGPLKWGAWKIKRRCIEFGLLRNECYTCSLPPTWNGMPIALQIDHENGDRHDNRLENLRILCPNCHSQTDSYAGRNANRYGKRNIPRN